MTVHDNGPGIPEEVRELAFERFFTTKGRRGTGLGLAISKEIVEQHEGTIILRSTPGEFTEFCVSFPKRAMTDAATQPTAKTVLVVDDEQDVRRLFLQRFRRGIRNGLAEFVFAAPEPRR